MWQPGDVIAWRGIYKERVWNAVPTSVLKDSSEELVLVLMPGTECKDEDDYQKAIDYGIIFPEWVQGIEDAKQEIFNKLEKRQYPFDGQWLNWMPDPSCSPPKLPANWPEM